MFPLPVDLACPPASPDSPVTVEVVRAGVIHQSLKFVVDTGEDGPIDLPMLVGVVRGPHGTLLVDTGLGTTTRTGEFPRFPLASPRQEVPAGEAIVERVPQVDRVLMTHLHYDHVGGLFDLPGVPTWTTTGDWAWVQSGAPGFPNRLETAVDWQVQDFAPGVAARVLGRPALDVLGDGTVWYLSIPGHSPGAAAVLVRAADGPILFVGDTAWVEAHLHEARRPAIVAAVVDANLRQLEDSLGWARWLRANCPDLRIVPGHEPAWADGTP